MEPKVFEYRCGSKWTAERKGISFSDGKPEIEVACPPEFGGHEGYWTPEHLFILSVEACLMATFLSLIEKKGPVLVSYRSETTGKASVRDWTFRFTEILIKPEILVKGEGSIGEARDALERAVDQCLISKSLSIRPVIEPVIESVT